MRKYISRESTRDQVRYSTPLFKRWRLLSSSVFLSSPFPPLSKHVCSINLDSLTLLMQGAVINSLTLLTALTPSVNQLSYEVFIRPVLIFPAVAALNEGSNVFKLRPLGEASTEALSVATLASLIVSSCGFLIVLFPLAWSNRRARFLRWIDLPR